MEYVYFPPFILEEMLKMDGLTSQRDEILMHLKSGGIIKVDAVGLTRRLQIAGERREYYQIQREFFNALGLPEIIDLAKES